MATVIGVRFKNSGKSYYFDPDELEIQKGDSVIVETARGVELGAVTMGRTAVSEDEVVAPLKKVLRVATDEDTERAARNREREKEAFDICVKKILAHNLEMKLIDAEYTFDNNKILFYFTSDGRVDFRELVKDLASVFRTRIELRQIGVRDEAKMLGGIGICGRCLCCNSFLGDFHPVSIKMAKEQGLSLNPTKISGSCGRLMCCLKYEQEAYEYMLSKTPNVGATVETDQGRGVVTGVSLLKGLLKVRLDHMNETDLVEFNVDDVKFSRNTPRHGREKPAEPDEDTTADDAVTTVGSTTEAEHTTEAEDTIAAESSAKAALNTASPNDAAIATGAAAAGAAGTDYE